MKQERERERERNCRGRRISTIHGENDDVNNANARMVDESRLFQSQESIWRISLSLFLLPFSSPLARVFTIEFILINTTRRGGEFIYCLHINGDPRSSVQVNNRSGNMGGGNGPLVYFFTSLSPGSLVLRGPCFDRIILSEAD